MVCASLSSWSVPGVYATAAARILACRLADAVVGVAGTVRENVRLRRGFRLAAAPGGLVGCYLHQSVAPGLGRIAGLVALECSQPLAGDAAAAAQVGRGAVLLASLSGCIVCAVNAAWLCIPLCIGWRLALLSLVQQICAADGRRPMHPHRALRLG